MKVTLQRFYAFAALLLNGCVGFTVHQGLEGHTYAYPVEPRTKTDIGKAFGEPNKKLVRDGNDVWVYDSSLDWRGVIFWLGVPIPLMVPVGRDEHTVTFGPDGLERQRHEYVTRSLFVGCGLHTFSCGYVRFPVTF